MATYYMKRRLLYKVDDGKVKLRTIGNPGSWVDSVDYRHLPYFESEVKRRQIFKLRTQNEAAVIAFYERESSGAA